jgi:hypothetical protein
VYRGDDFLYHIELSSIVSSSVRGNIVSENCSVKIRKLYQ